MKNPWAYTETVKEHFLNPRNFLMGDETKFKADGEGIVGNPICGDQMLIKIQVKTRENGEEYISDIGWKTYGCASAIASTSALSELAKNRTLEDADKISAKEICDYLGGLPEHKFHCSVLGHQALHKAIKNYQEKKAPEGAS
ncbi:MAG: iron-sulfur cluster assembly scaffold protein [Clostridia bacterium]|nr:iron-sulfur cluster assembly scaffold protein [Clostridia bacterium]MBR3180906.1 iron-sulfur cluster assembly scaffold protein [Candidatus Saccharibacteria bacterium]